MNPSLRDRLLALYRSDHPLWLLLGCNLALVTVLFAFLIPWQEDMAAMRAGLERDLVRIRGEIGKAETDLARIDRDGETFGHLLEKGWLSPQDRLAAARIIERVGDEHGLVRLDYQFQPEKHLAVNDPQMRGVTIVETGIQFTFQAVLDSDILPALARLQYELPGSLDIEGISLARRKPLELADLLALEAGETVPLVDGTASLMWRTLTVEGTPPVPMAPVSPPGPAASADSGIRPFAQLPGNHRS